MLRPGGRRRHGAGEPRRRATGIAEPGAANACAAIERTGLPSARPPNQTPDEILSATRGDKKARSGVVEYALPARIGAMAGADQGWGVAVADDVVLEVLQ
jgi:3-dehydroquinate synthetase